MKIFTKDDKSFFIGLLIMNIVLFSFFEIFIIHPPDFLKNKIYLKEKKINKKQQNN